MTPRGTEGSLGTPGVPEGVPGTVQPAALAGSADLARSAAWSTGGIVAQGVARLAYTVVIGRSLGSADLGHVSAVLSLSIFMALVWPTAAGNAASRYIAFAVARGQDDRAVVRLLTRTWAVSVVVLAAVAVPVAWGWTHDGVLAATAAWTVAGYGAYAYARTGALGRGRARRVGLADLGTGLLAVAGLAVVLAVGAHSWVLVPISLGYTVFAVVCWPRGVAGDTELPRTGVLSFAAWNVLAGLATNGLLQLAMISAEVFAAPAQVGVYAAAFTIATPASMVGQAVSQIIVPAFAHEAGNGSLRDRRRLAVFLVFTAGCVVVFGAIAALAGFVMPLFYPEQGVAAAPVLRGLLVGVFVFTIALVPAAFLLAAGRSGEVAVASLTGLVVGVVVIAVSVSSAPLTAGTTGFVVGSVVSLVALVLIGFRSGRASEGDQTKRRATVQ
ncbi:lipopolysaccharide biosynthesis protein [Curtobacterium sp. MCBA15_001]|uniref:lipopolysaccharide biosynthesis protein n=1 Tax=Curtobacterium sp. MCBA15_001 TaxID=1898731 RepID=UPI001113B147|nr:lipopolysaccharide biosynthesis protein [Curtobacterium sp. MCBA15_001]